MTQRGFMMIFPKIPTIDTPWFDRVDEVWGCLLWVQPRIYVLHQSVHHCKEHHTILNRLIVAPKCDNVNQLKVQSSTVIKRSNIVKYYINNYINWGRISIICWIHKRRTIPRPNRRAMECLLRMFLGNWPHFNSTALHQHQNNVHVRINNIRLSNLYIIRYVFNDTRMTPNHKWREIIVV